MQCEINVSDSVKLWDTIGVIISGMVQVMVIAFNLKHHMLTWFETIGMLRYVIMHAKDNQILMCGKCHNAKPKETLAVWMFHKI